MRRLCSPTPTSRLGGVLLVLVLGACTERNPAYQPDSKPAGDGAAECRDECEEGELRCVDGGFVRCGQADSDPCRDWSEVIRCGAGEICAEGRCVAGACEPSCAGKLCGADDGCGNPCLSGGCPPHASCVNGACQCEGVICGSVCCAAGQVCSANGACAVVTDCEHQFVKTAQRVNELVTQGWTPIVFLADATFSTYGAWLQGGGAYRYVDTVVEATIGSVVQSGGTLEAFFRFDRNVSWEGALMQRNGSYDVVSGEQAVNNAVAQGFSPVAFFADATFSSYGAWLQGGGTYRFVDADVMAAIGAVVKGGGTLEAFFRFNGNGAWAGALMRKGDEFQFVSGEQNVNGAAAQGWTPITFLADAGYTTQAAWLEGGGTYRYVTSNVEATISAVVVAGGSLRAFFNFDHNSSWHGALMRRGCTP